MIDKTQMDNLATQVENMVSSVRNTNSVTVQSNIMILTSALTFLQEVSKENESLNNEKANLIGDFATYAQAEIKKKIATQHPTEDVFARILNRLYKHLRTHHGMSRPMKNTPRKFVSGLYVATNDWVNAQDWVALVRDVEREIIDERILEEKHRIARNEACEKLTKHIGIDCDEYAMRKDFVFGNIKTDNKFL